MTNTPLTNGLRFSLPAPEAPADQVFFAAAYWPGLTVEAAVAKLMLPQLGSTTTAVDGQDFVNSQGVLLKWIQPGTFQMGSTEGTDPDRTKNEEQHTVILTRGFWLSDHEVTQAEYQAVMGNNPSKFTGDLNLPVEEVNWYEAVSYCQKLTEQERAAGRITAQQAYRLPTEAEWEYACRAGTTGAR